MATTTAHKAAAAGTENPQAEEVLPGLDADAVDADLDIPVDTTDEGEFEITDGEDLFQSGEKEGFGDGEYEYVLTAFVPACTAAKDSRQAPSGAALWVIPDITDVKYLRTLKIFKMTWLDKIPASYNTLFVRPDRDNNPNPTSFQQQIISTTISKYTDKDGVPTISQTVLIPIINLYEGKPVVTIGEMSNACYKALVKFNNEADDTTDGLVTTKTRPVYIWREGKGNKTTYGFRFYKGTDFDVKTLLAANEMLDVKEYVKKRAVATEKWFAKKRTQFLAGELEGGSAEETTDSENYIDALMDLPTPILKTVLSEAGLDITGLRTKQALVDLATAHEELLTEAVMAARPEPAEAE